MTVNMFSPIKYSVLASVLATTSHAQSSSDSNSQSLTCDGFSEALAYNASATQNTSALNFAYLGAYEAVTISEDDTATWKISSYIGPVYDGHGGNYSENHTQAVLWFDTENTDMERLGDRIGLCHNYVPLQDHPNGNLSWSREVLERSQKDNGDCKTMLGEECVAALETWYEGQGFGVWSTDEHPACGTTQNTIPSVCEGMLSKPVTMDVLPLNTSAEDRISRWNPGANITSYPDNATLPTCGDRNLSSSWGNRLYYMTDYDLALNFPIVDIMMFYPTVPITKGLRTKSVYAKAVCLKPGNVQENSRTPRSAKEVLDEIYGSQNDENNGSQNGENKDPQDGGNKGPQNDESSAERTFGWSGKAALASVVGTMVGVWLGL